MRPSVAVLGAGTLGEIVIEALLRAGWPSDDVLASERRDERADELSQSHGIRVVGDAREIISESQVLVFAVKPDDVDALLTSVADRVGPDRVVLSLCAGVPTVRFETILGNVPVVRSMPNTPAAVGAGMTAYARGRHVGDSHMALCRQILITFGQAVEVPESCLDAVTAVSGSGPAYVFLLAEAMERAAVDLGLPAEVASQLVNQTIDGSGSLLNASPQTASELRRAVTSPGGTTAAAIDVFEEAGFSDLVVDALRAAATRSAELGAG